MSDKGTIREFKVERLSDSSREILAADRAITTVAQQAIHVATAQQETAWEDYPEIGENDWDVVLREIDRIAPAPDHAEYEAAYALLTARADHDA